MKFLLDTHTLLWWFDDDSKLSANARGVIAQTANSIMVSSASGWEIATKFRLGKLPGAQVLMPDIDACVRKAGFTPLPIDMRHAQRAGTWPQAHRDPFDRMLAAQSSIENVPLITCDQALQAFGVAIYW